MLCSYLPVGPQHVYMLCFCWEVSINLLLNNLNVWALNWWCFCRRGLGESLAFKKKCPRSSYCHKTSQSCGCSEILLIIWWRLWFVHCQCFTPSSVAYLGCNVLNAHLNKGLRVDLFTWYVLYSNWFCHLNKEGIYGGSSCATHLWIF